PPLGSGHFVGARVLVSPTGRGGPPTGRPPPPPQGGVGRLLSVPHVLGNPADKCRLGQQYDALAADMESAAVADFCSAHKVPFACLRAVSDDLATSVPAELADVVAGGRISWPRLMIALLRSPGLLGPLLRLERASRYAAEQLGMALATMLRKPNPS
ncbi:MAG: hypothetical protein NZ700_08535, partial [Gemmataceae bacterium]|nr:hypothetical protein [Gemmataceae bacterium]MDW8266178.1 hypothetical protein [Gemmataceae bacterium]